MASFKSLQAICVALLAAAACSPSVEPSLNNLEQDGYTDILFIGNSLTYTYDLPDVVAQMSRIMQDSPVIRVGMVAEPDYNLEDHWALGSAQRAIATPGWEYVVLQQGPSSVEVNRQQLIRSAQAYGELIVRAGATPALFMAWPQEHRIVDYSRALESYRLAAVAVNGKLLPVAAAWHIVLTNDPDIELYSDGLHASVAGTYLAAAVIYGAVRNKSVAGLADEITTQRMRIAVPSAVGAILRAAADSANGLYR